MNAFWRKCSTCKTPIPHNHVYWVCNVTTCNQRSTAFVFCSVDCWDAHVPTMRHKDAWAEERRSPQTHETAAKVHESRPAPRKKTVDMRPAPTSGSERATTAGTLTTKLEPRPPDEVLVVASKVKAYIRARSGLNTSAGVMDALSEKVRRICDLAIRSAFENERKTVLDRDVPR